LRLASGALLATQLSVGAYLMHAGQFIKHHEAEELRAPAVATPAA
jgi:hypothetical protein